MVHVAILIPLFWLHISIAAFTQPTQWPGTNLIIEQNSASTWCFLPVAGDTTAVDCKGNQADLQGSLTAHLQQTLSIAYYNPIDNTRMGGATWSIVNTTELIHLCASGMGGDGIVQTICSTVDGDNQLEGSPYCQVAVGPPVVSDGCYSKATTTTAGTPPSSIPSLTSTSTSLQSPSSAASMASKTSSATSSSGTTITVITSPRPTNWVTQIFVPIFCSVLGVVAAIIGLKLCC